MKAQAIDTLLVLFLALNLMALGTSRIQSAIRIVAVQGVLLGLVTLLMHERASVSVLLSAGAAIAIKAILIPSIMLHSMRSADIKREFEPLIGFLPSILIASLATAACLMLAPAPSGLSSGTEGVSLIIPASIATMAVGFLFLVTRYKAISQVLGYLVLENGIYLFGALLVEAIPLVVEMGMLLDLFVGVFVITIITNHINRAFASTDTRRLISLKE